jgi:hypothetical protein
MGCNSSRLPETILDVAPSPHDTRTVISIDFHLDWDDFNQHHGGTIVNAIDSVCKRQFDAPVSSTAEDVEFIIDNLSDALPYPPSGLLTIRAVYFDNSALGSTSLWRPFEGTARLNEFPLQLIKSFEIVDPPKRENSVRPRSSPIPCVEFYEKKGGKCIPCTKCEGGRERGECKRCTCECDGGPDVKMFRSQGQRGTSNKGASTTSNLSSKRSYGELGIEGDDRPPSSKKLRPSLTLLGGKHSSDKDMLKGGMYDEAMDAADEEATREKEGIVPGQSIFNSMVMKNLVTAFGLAGDWHLTRLPAKGFDEESRVSTRFRDPNLLILLKMMLEKVAVVMDPCTDASTTSLSVGFDICGFGDLPDICKITYFPGLIYSSMYCSSSSLAHITFYIPLFIHTQ